LRFIQEFIDLMVPHKHLAKPVEYDEVREHCQRATQKVAFDAANMDPRDIDEGRTEVFVKAESYDDVKDPRIISNTRGPQKPRYAAFVYRVAEVLRNCPWYAFGKTPVEIAGRVAEICEAAQNVAKTDFSRMDGRVSKRARLFEQMFMLALFDKLYHVELLALLGSQHTRRAVTTFGVKYDTFWARLSGSHETADFNSLLNALIAFISFRLMGHDAGTAFALLGIYAGDDGLSANVDPSIYADAAARMDQVLDIELVKRGDPGVAFLAREYGPYAWHGQPDSMCDFKRSLLKIHVTTSLPPNISPLQKLGEKLIGLHLSDPNTPFIKELVSVFRIVHSDWFPKFPDMQLKIAGWWAQYDADVQYPNENVADWMSDVIRKQLPDFNATRFLAWVADVQAGRASILSAPVCSDDPPKPKPKKDVVINNDVLKPDSKKICRAFLSAGGCKFKDCKYQHLARVDKPCKYGDACKHKDGCIFKH